LKIERVIMTAIGDEVILNETVKFYEILQENFPRVVTGEKNIPTVAYACCKRQLKWVLPQVWGWSTGLATLPL
jgi:hypothetical protein